MAWYNRIKTRAKSLWVDLYIDWKQSIYKSALFVFEYRNSKIYMKEMIEMYIKCEKIKELAEKIEKETLNDCEVKYEGKEDERIEIWTKTYECFSYTSERGLIFEMQDGYLTEKEIEYLFNEYKKIKEVIRNFLEQKEK